MLKGIPNVKYTDFVKDVCDLILNNSYWKSPGGLSKYAAINLWFSGRTGLMVCINLFVSSMAMGADKHDKSMVIIPQ